MSPRVWQAIAVTIGVLLLGSVAIDSVAGLMANGHLAFSGTFSGAPTEVVVRRIVEPSAIQGSLHIGDRVSLDDRSVWNQLRFLRQRPGDRFTFTGTSARGEPVRVVAPIVPVGPAAPNYWLYQLLRLALVLVGLVVAVRRPADRVARAMVGLFFLLAALVQLGSPYYPVWLVGVTLVISRASQIYVAYAALALAVAFPERSTRGVRRWLERANLPYSILCVATLFYALTLVVVVLVPSPPWLQGIGLAETALYFLAIAVAFVVGGRGATGADRKRVQWVAWTIGAGFSGTVVAIVLLLAKVPYGPIYEWLGVTLLAIPFGLGYAIVRHRVVDIGFVVNRALVFAGVSAVVLIAFGILEWILSNAFVRISHITSTSLELALALALGFSLRWIHARVDRVVDDLFFRDRHEADRALRTAARELAYITDPRIAVERAHAELLARAGASSVSIYLVDGTRALRVDPGEGGAPDAAGVDDAALVRMRASRMPCDLHELRTAFEGEWAFPMCVHDVMTGTVVLGPKVNGEAYAPDELATIEALTLALGNALDALQTAALKTEVARVLLDGAPLEALRRTIDAASWARGVAAQPAGSLPGLGE